jgi:hypothetical protein
MGLVTSRLMLKQANSQALNPELFGHSCMIDCYVLFVDHSKAIAGMHIYMQVMREIQKEVVVC